MRKYLLPCLLLTLIAVVIASCGKDDTTRPLPPRVDSLAWRFPATSSFIYGTWPLGVGEPLPMLLFSYRDGKPYLRTGGSIGILDQYSRLVYDSVAYSGNSLITIVTITRHYRGTEINMPLSRRDIILENGRITHQITEKDTSFYYYDGNRIARREIRSQHHIIKQQFHFNLSGNLEKVNTTDSSITANMVFTNTEETFGGYDNAPNPLRQRFLAIWEDLFYRSLSVNNYTQYHSETHTPGSSELPATVNIVNTFYYHNDGTLDFTR